MTPSEDPWKSIVPPTQNDQIHALRVPNTGDLDWGLYWAKDSLKRCLLILQHDSDRLHTQRLPKLQGLQVEVLNTENRSGKRLVIRLMDSGQRDVFHRFCIDIINTTNASPSQEEAIKSFLIRIWRWHHLLRGGSDGLLSLKEQKGLIGELSVLEYQLLPFTDAVSALRSWMGPDGAPKDFQVGNVAIEAKTRSPHVSTIGISSAEQLDKMASERLFLHVTEVSEALGNSDAVTITDVVLRIRDTFVTFDISAVTLFEERLSAAGFDWNDDYSGHPLLIGGFFLYEVVDGFPCITPLMSPPGVKCLRYTIELNQCKRFRVDMKVMTRLLSGEGNGN